MKTNLSIFVFSYRFMLQLPIHMIKYVLPFYLKDRSRILHEMQLVESQIKYYTDTEKKVNKKFLRDQTNFYQPDALYKAKVLYILSISVYPRSVAELCQEIISREPEKGHPRLRTTIFEVLKKQLKEGTIVKIREKSIPLRYKLATNTPSLSKDQSKEKKKYAYRSALSDYYSNLKQEMVEIDQVLLKMYPYCINEEKIHLEPIIRASYPTGSTLEKILFVMRLEQRALSVHEVIEKLKFFERSAELKVADVRIHILLADLFRMGHLQRKGSLGDFNYEVV